MEIVRAYAYSVYPQKNVSQMRAPEGGAVKMTPLLEAVIAANLKEAQFATRPSVLFNLDTTTRTCDVRDALVTFAFGAPASARSACSMLANRLGGAMDQRSSPAMLLVVAFDTGSKKTTVIWIFPNEEAFRFKRGTEEADIEVLTDVFSQRSKLRKAAMFNGAQTKADFLEGRILDLQAGSRKQDVAEFFVNAFLDCRLSITSDVGSRILAETIRKLHEQLKDPGERERLHASIIAVRNGPIEQITLVDFASAYLSSDLAERFIDLAPNLETAMTPFVFSKTSFDDVLQFRVFILEDGSYVYSPMASVGKNVRVVDGRLICEGAIESERLRTNHG